MEPEGIELVGITWDHPRGHAPLVAASRLYRERTGVGVRWERRSLQAFADAPIEDLARRYDLIVLDHPHVGQIAETGALLALPAPEDPDASIGGSAESYLWAGKFWAYAIDASCQMAVCRPDLAQALPERWEQFLDPEARAFRPLTPLLPVDAFDMFMTLVAGRGGERMPADPRHFVSPENGLYALGILRALYRLGPEEQLEMSPIPVLETLSTCDDFACSPCLFGYVNYARPGFRPHRLRYFDLPLSEGFDRPRAILGGAGIGVSARTAHPAAALDFARWVASREVQTGVWLANEGQPAHRRAWIEQRDNPQLEGFFAGAFHTLDTAWTRPRAAWFLGFVDDVCALMPEILRRPIPAEDALERIDRIYRHHVERAEPCRQPS